MWSLRMLYLLKYSVVFILTCVSAGSSNSLLKFVQCRVCETVQMEGPISDCSCDFQSVNGAVTTFFMPLLTEITRKTFFRYFHVDLSRPCPFWQEDAHCVMEGCSVCACNENEIPSAWREGQLNQINNNQEFGWVTSGFKGEYSGELLERLNMSLSTSLPGEEVENYLAYLAVMDDENNGWTDMVEGLNPTGPGASRPSGGGVYVNLLVNPERFTGYSGPSAARVWRSIQQENCFGMQNDMCLEKRVFYRLMSGLQSSISIHIARQYYYPDGHWDTNMPLFVRAVGSHPDRLSNLYFAFLVVLRSVVKAGDYLTSYPYRTGNITDDDAVRRLIKDLVTAHLPESIGGLGGGGAHSDALEGMPIVRRRRIIARKNTSYNREEQQEEEGQEEETNVLEECRNGFDESALFQVNELPTHWTEAQYLPQGQEEKDILREEFRNRFRNISRIMDCVSCEKCRVWGKLQILGLGTAIKILLTPEEDLAAPSNILNRQEIIALLNLLRQLSVSVAFAAEAGELELADKISGAMQKFRVLAIVVALISFLFTAAYYMKRAMYSYTYARAGATGSSSSSGSSVSNSSDEGGGGDVAVNEKED